MQKHEKTKYTLTDSPGIKRMRNSQVLLIQSTWLSDDQQV